MPVKKKGLSQTRPLVLAGRYGLAGDMEVPGHVRAHCQPEADLPACGRHHAQVLDKVRA